MAVPIAPVAVTRIRRPHFRLALLCCALLVAAPHARAASTYTCTVVPIDTGGAQFPYVFPTSIDNRRHVAGIVTGPIIGFVADETGANVPYPPPPNGNVIYATTNNQGQVAGWTGDPRSPWYPVPGSGLQPAHGFLSNPDGSVFTLDPPANTAIRSFGDIRVSSINDNGDILGEISVTDQGEQLQQYWFIRGADGIYAIFGPHSGPGRRFDRGNLVDTPGAFINNSRTAVLNNVLRRSDGSETPITFRGSSAYPWTWWGINNAGSIVGNFARYPYTPPFSVLLSPDGNAPAVVCPNNEPPSVLAFSINDKGVIAGAEPSGSSVIFLNPTGIHSGVTLSNASWGFSPSPVNEQGGSGIIYLSNSGAADLNIESVIIAGRDAADSPADFSLVVSGTTCIGLADVGGGRLANIPKTFTPGEFCTISFSFTPRGVGARTAQLVIYDDAPDAPHVVRLDGTGLGKRNLVVSNNSWMAGGHPVGQPTGPGTIYIYNPGTDPIDVADVSFSGTNATDFHITNNTCGSTIAPYTTCAVSFVFTPAASGFRAAVLTLTDNSPVHQQVIPIGGYGF